MMERLLLQLEFAWMRICEDPRRPPTTAMGAMVKARSSQKARIGYAAQLLALLLWWPVGVLFVFA